MKSHAGEICHQYSSVVTAIIPYLTHNKTPVHSTLGIIESVCGLPDLTGVPSSVALGTTSKIRSPLGPRRIQQDLVIHLCVETLIIHLCVETQQTVSYGTKQNVQFLFRNDFALLYVHSVTELRFRLLRLYNMLDT